MFRTVRIAIIVALTLAAFIHITAVPAAADEEPNMVVEPSRGPVGTAVHVRMSGVPGEGQVTIAFDSKDNIVQTVKPDEWGDFTASFSVGTYPAGSYRVWVRCTTRDFYAHFLLEPSVKLDKKGGYVGDSVVVSGAGFAAEKDLTVYFDEAPVATGKTEKDGVFRNALFTVPESSRGNHVVKVVDDAGNSASASIVTRQNLTVAPKSGAADSEVTLAGTGFEANASLVVYFDGEAVTGALTDEKGNFNTAFHVPVRRTDIYKIKVSDGVSTFYEDFTVVPGILLTPQSGGVGSYLTVRGSGFRVGLPVAVSYDGDEVASTSTDAQGAFEVNFRVPQGQAGEHKVSASDGASNVAAIYIVESDPPPPPRLILPRSETETASAAYFDWEGVSDASGVTYTLVVASDVNFSNVLLTKEGLTESEYTLSEEEKLPPKTEEYFWRVKGVDGASNEGEWSVPGTFYVSSPLSSPGMLLPLESAEVVGMVRFDWEDVAGAVTYDLAVAYDPDFLKGVLLREGLSMSEYTLTLGEELPSSQGSPYYWRVRSSGSSSRWSPARSFYVKKPVSPPELIEPAAGEKVPPTVRFDWEDADHPGEAMYRLVIASNPDFSSVLLTKEGLTESQYVLSEEEKLLPRENPLYWRVAVEKDGSTSVWSMARLFYISSFPAVPGWVWYSLIALGLVLLCFVCFWIGGTRALSLQAKLKANEQEGREP